MSLASRRALPPLLVILLLAAVYTSGCVSPPGYAQATSSPAPVPGLNATSTATVTAVPTAPVYVPAEKPSATPAGVQASAGVIFEPVYNWEYKDVQWHFKMVIPESAYDYFKKKPRTPGLNYADYALADEDRETLRDVAADISRYGEGQGYSEYDQAANVLTFVQSLPYVKDRDSVGIAEYPRYPIETLKDGEGDCEDKTILAAALLREMGLETVILMLPDHSAVGIAVDNATGACYEYEGKRYYYAETSSAGWDIGEQPAEMRGASATVVPLEKSPVLGLDVTATSTSSDHASVYFTTRYTVKNAGPGKAKGLVLRIRALAPERGDSQFWPPERTVELGDLAEGSSCSGETTLTIPQGELSQIECVLSGDNCATKTDRTDVFRAVM